MALSIGRKGFIGIGLQSGFDVPAAIADYAPFMTNTLRETQQQLEVKQATGNRETVSSTITGKRFSEGEIDVLVDNKFAGYFLVAAMGSVSAASQGSSVFDHTITRNNSNVPQFLSIVNDRVVDRQYYPNCAVDELTLEVATDLATLKAKINGDTPVTTTSGTNTTASGNVFAFKDARFAFGTTVSNAQNANNLKPHDFKFTLKNNTDPIHRHGSADVDSINHKGFDIDCEFTLYFENTTDRDSYYNQSKQAGSFQLTGNGIGGGFTERLQVNLYQSSFSGFELETGLDNFYAEKAKLNGEYDNANSKTVDMVLRNTKTLYI